jgi:hypothetical protein
MFPSTFKEKMPTHHQAEKINKKDSFILALMMMAMANAYSSLARKEEKT